MYAVLETGGKQYRVKSGDKFEIERLNVEAGQSVTFDKILLINQDGNFKVGTPTVESATVVADVLLHKKGPKVTSFKMRLKSCNYQADGFLSSVRRQLSWNGSLHSAPQA